MSPLGGGTPHETEAERLDRELNELLQELRVLLPGTTVLFGFLLALSFSQQFGDVTGPERALFVVAFLATAVCAVLLTAPGVRHRTRFRERDKKALLASANRLTIAASFLLAVSVSAVTTLVVEHVYGWGAGIGAGGTVFALALWFWYGWAVLRRVRVDGGDGDGGHDAPFDDGDRGFDDFTPSRSLPTWGSPPAARGPAGTRVGAEPRVRDR